MNLLEKKQIILKNNEIFSWRKGLRLKLISPEICIIIFPGELMNGNIKFQDVIAISDEKTRIAFEENKINKNLFSKIFVELKANNIIKVNKNVEAIIQFTLKNEAIFEAYQMIKLV